MGLVLCSSCKSRQTIRLRKGLETILWITITESKKILTFDIKFMNLVNHP